MNTLTIRLGLNEQITLCHDNGTETILRYGTAEETLRKILRAMEPIRNVLVPAELPPVPKDFPVKKFTKTGRPVLPTLSLEDLGL